MSNHDAFFHEAEAVLDELARSQQERRLAAARRLIPLVISDDLEQPHDFPELADDALFNYEDGVLAGILSAQMALRARVWKARREP